MIYDKWFDTHDLIVDGVIVRKADGKGTFSCICDVCGKKFYKLVGLGTFRGRTDVCSDSCAHIRDLKKQREKREKERKRKCLLCKKTFTPARNDAKYCCNACKQEAYRRRSTKQC